MSEWTKIGDVEVREYPGGVTVVFCPSTGRLPVRELLAFKGGKLIGSEHAGKEYADTMYEPQPELVDRTKDATYMRHGERSAFVCRPYVNTVDYWAVAANIVFGGEHSRKTREEAEAHARKLVMGEAGK